MDTRSRPAVGTTCPGSDPAALRVITVAVLAGLVISGIVVISRQDTASLSGASAVMEQTAPDGLTRPAQHGASSVRLLSQAAQACSRMSYQGEEMLSDWGQPGAGWTGCAIVTPPEVCQTSMTEVAGPAWLQLLSISSPW